VTENQTSNGGFEARLHRSGRILAVPPGETILDVLLDACVNVSFSCTEGICGRARAARRSASAQAPRRA
jgi:vanillate O-demethylase ferredoxin subunit